MFSLNMLTIALELARHQIAYEDIATKFFEHFLYIAGAMNDLGGTGIDLWDEEDGFFYDVLLTPDGPPKELKVHSLVGLIPLLAVETLDPDLRRDLPRFDRRLHWFLTNRPDLAQLVPSWDESGAAEHRLLSLVPGDRMRRVLSRMLDPDEFLSEHGIRSVSKFHDQHPYVFDVSGTPYIVDYEPAESRSGLFGGNSNWRGPIWFPINYLLIEALRRFDRYYGASFTVACPTGAATAVTLGVVADELSRRLVSIFLAQPDGRRPVFGNNGFAQSDPHWRDHLLFYEYFQGDSGAGLGASHQTGWTALVAALLTQAAARGGEG